MSVRWGESALGSRMAFLDQALSSAIAESDPQRYHAAVATDALIQADADDLDGVATYRAGPVFGTHIKPAGRGGSCWSTGATAAMRWCWSCCRRVAIGSASHPDR